MLMLISQPFKSKVKLQRIGRGKPARFNFFRTNPGLPLREGVSEVRRCVSIGMLKYQDDNDGKRYEYGCTNAVTAAYESTGVVVRHTVYLVQYQKSRRPFLWTIATPTTREMHASSKSQLNIAEEAVDHWFGIEWDGNDNKRVDPEPNAEMLWREPTWEAIKSWDEAIRLAFPGSEMIRDINNQLILDMLGRAAR
jgi:hypothetical protein